MGFASKVIYFVDFRCKFGTLGADEIVKYSVLATMRGTNKCLFYCVRWRMRIIKNMLFYFDVS